MSHSATASKSAGKRTGRHGRRHLGIVVFLTLAVHSPTGVFGQASREEVLIRVYPDADIQAERVFLTEAQRQAAAVAAGVDIPSLLIARYVARRDGVVIGRAYVDTHVVRTKNESLLVCLDADGSLRRIEVTAFLEPPEYLASEAWYAQYEGKALNDDLDLNRAIRPIAGATLTATATASAVRRVLGIDRALMQTVEEER